MFTELAPLLAKRSFVLILTGQDDGSIRCNFVPKSTDKDTDTDKALLTPLTITGTPAELDSDLSGVLTEYRTAYLSMHESVASTKAMMAEAKAASDAEAKAKADALKKTGKQSTKAPTPAEAKKNTGTPSLFDGNAAPPPPSLFSAAPAAEDEEEDEPTTQEEVEQEEAWQA